MTKPKKALAALCAATVLSSAAGAQTADPSLGRAIAEKTCSFCHQIAPGAASQNPDSKAPSFVDIARMPSTNERSINVFLRSSHRNMPNIMLTPDEIDSLAAYIVGLSKN